MMQRGGGNIVTEGMMSRLLVMSRRGDQQTNGTHSIGETFAV